MGSLHWDDDYDHENTRATPSKKYVLPWQLFRYATVSDVFLFLIGCVAAAGTGAGLPVFSILMGTATQAFTNLAINRDIGQFSHDVEDSCIKFAILGGVVYICAIIQSLCSVVVCDRMIDRLRKEFLKSILRQDISWFDRNHSGDLAPKLFDNLERVREGSGDKISLIVQLLAQFVGGFAVALSHDWQLSLILMSLSPLIMICGAYVGKMMATATAIEAEMYGSAGSVAEEVLSSIRTVIAFNAQEYESSRYDSALIGGRRAGIVKSVKSGIGLGMMFLFMFTSFGLAFWVGTSFVAEGKTDGGTVLTVFFSVMMGSMALGSAGPQFGIVGTALGAAASLYDIIDREPGIDSYSKDGKTPVNMKGQITIKEVHFAYPTRPDVQVLQGVSLTALPGQTVALVGSSGCGKSTILQLLLRYYEQSTGTIKIDGHCLEDLNINFLRNFLGVVSQEPNLFNTTIEENIRYGRKDVSEQEVVTALKRANAYSFVQNFPEGLRTMVGDRGAQLSGGQKQRLAIARALVRNPKILLLDEATSALDAQSEHVVQKALENASKGRTTIVIAHRLSTIRNADKIVAMKEGKVVEIGTHDTLMSKKGFYYNLVNAQVFSATDEEKRRSLSVLSDRSRTSTVHNVNEKTIEKMQSVNETTVEDNSARLARESKEQGVESANLFKILSRAGPEWPYLALGFLSAAVQGCVFPSFSLLFVQLIQTFSKPVDEMKKDGHFWALFFLGLGGTMLVTMIAQSSLFGVAAERLTMRLRSMVFRNILRMDAAYFDEPRHSSGKIATRLANDAPSLRAAIDFRLASAFSAVVGVIFGIGIAFYYGWQMALLTVSVFPLVALGQGIQQYVMVGDAGSDANELEHSGKTAMEAIENIRTVQALTMEQTLYDQFCQFISKPSSSTLKKAILQGITYGFATSIFFFIFASSFRFGLWLIVNHHMTPYNVLRVLFASAFTAQSLGMFSGYFSEYTKATLAAGLIFRMLEEKPEIDGMTETGPKPALNGNVNFENVHFNYPQRPDNPILRGLNVEVENGKTLALVGPSGCGKSTVVGLLERLYDTSEGRVTVDGHDVRGMNARHLRSHISLVAQEPILFDRSIKENIIYGLEGTSSQEGTFSLEGTVTQSQVEEACRKANIHKFISGLPAGYDTRVGERGAQLSGGQKQRIAIARALVRDPRILLLDEATSALDSESEKVVQEALNKASVGRTCIVIAHRLSTIVNADSIAVVNEGRVVEQGTHKELMQLRGVYYNLTMKQSASKDR